MLSSADGNGDEIDHLFVWDLEGVLTDIAPAKGAQSSFYSWLKDGPYLYTQSI
jgi:hypothetical protein